MKKFLGICLLFLLFSAVSFAEQPRVVSQDVGYDVGMVITADEPAMDCTMFMFMDYQMVGVVGECPTMEHEAPMCGSVEYPPYEVVYHIVDITANSNPPDAYRNNNGTFVIA